MTVVPRAVVGFGADESSMAARAEATVPQYGISENGVGFFLRECLWADGDLAPHAGSSKYRASKGGARRLSNACLGMGVAGRDIVAAGGSASLCDAVRDRDDVFRVFLCTLVLVFVASGSCNVHGHTFGSLGRLTDDVVSCSCTIL